MNRMSRPRIALLAMSVGCALVLAVESGCGGGSSGGGSNNPIAPTDPNTIVISSSGVVSPKELTVTAGSRVTFLNNDSVVHDMTSDPHPDHTDCLELAPVGRLAPGQSRQTNNLVTPKTCGFHDHDRSTNTNLQGRIIIR